MEPRNFSPSAPGNLHYSRAGYWTYHPHPLPPLFRWNDRLVAALSRADLASLRLGERLRAGPGGLVALLARLEAVESCRLAGIEADLAGLLRYEAGYRGPEGGEPLSAALRLAEAQEWLCEGARQGGLNISDLREAHALAWAGPPDPDCPPGDLRDRQTWIGGRRPAEADFVPPPPEAIWPALEGLLAFLRQADGPPLLIRAAMALYQIGVIQPFCSANGRIGRLLVQAMLAADDRLPGPGLPLSGFFARRMAGTQAKLVAVSRDNDWDGWLVFFLEAVRIQVETALGLEARLQAVRQEYGQRIAGERTAARLGQGLDLIVYRPYFNINQMEAVYPTGNFKSAARLVETLVRLGIVEEVTGQSRHRVFRARLALEAASRPGD